MDEENLPLRIDMIHKTYSDRISSRFKCACIFGAKLEVGVSCGQNVHIFGNCSDVDILSDAPFIVRYVDQGDWFFCRSFLAGLHKFDDIVLALNFCKFGIMTHSISSASCAATAP